MRIRPPFRPYNVRRRPEPGTTATHSTLDKHPHDMNRQQRRTEQAKLKRTVSASGGAGLGGGQRRGVLARRPAPVQVTARGHCGTTGLDAID